jgi:ATP adenylyltransferase
MESYHSHFFHCEHNHAKFGRLFTEEVMNLEELRSFINSKMSITHIYQPAILLTLLENDGQATVQLIAAKCAQLRGESPESYVSKLLKYPKEALTKHGVLDSTSNRSEFKLSVHVPDSAQQELISLCTTRLARIK